jgi:hypothetical protein
MRQALLQGQYWAGGRYPLGRARVDWADATSRLGANQYDGKLWLDKRDVIGVADGATIDTWPAKIGTDATQPAAGKRPALDKASGTIVFDAVDDGMQTFPDLSTSPTACVLATAYSTLAAGAGIAWEYTVNYNVNKGIIMLFTTQLVSVGSTILAYSVRRDAASVGSRLVTFGGRFDSRTTPEDMIDLWKADAGVAGEVTSFAVELDADGTGNYDAATSWLGSRNDGTAGTPLGGGIREFMLFGSYIPDIAWENITRAMALRADIL